MTDFYDDPRAIQVRHLMLNAVAEQLGHEKFTGNSMLELISLLEQGAANMVEGRRLEPGDMDEAVNNTVELLRQLKQVRDDWSLDYFTEQSVYQSRINLCPGFWPFC